MTDGDLQSSAPPPPQSTQAAAATKDLRQQSTASAPAPTSLPGFRMPAHGPAYQAMHAMLQRRREELTKVQAEGGSPTGVACLARSSVGAFPLSHPAASLPHVGMGRAAGGAKVSSVAPEPLQPMLSF